MEKKLISVLNGRSPSGDTDHFSFMGRAGSSTIDLFGADLFSLTLINPLTIQH